MNTSEYDLTPAQVAQTSANLRLASQFLREYLEDPGSIDPIPLGASLILLPPGEEDPELRNQNLEMARKLVEQGRKVVYWTVGMRPAHKKPLNQKQA